MIDEILKIFMKMFSYSLIRKFKFANTRHGGTQKMPSKFAQILKWPKSNKKFARF